MTKMEMTKIKEMTKMEMKRQIVERKRENVLVLKIKEPGCRIVYLYTKFKIRLYLFIVFTLKKTMVFV
jgi:hypothetical protein